MIGTIVTRSLLKVPFLICRLEVNFQHFLANVSKNVNKIT